MSFQESGSSGAKPAESLATYVSGLRRGSACFCCGEPMRTLGSVPGARSGSDETEGVLCPSCGGSVLEVKSGATAANPAQNGTDVGPGLRSTSRVVRRRPLAAGGRTRVRVSRADAVRLFR